MTANDSAPEPRESFQERHLFIEGMTCGSCVARIEKALEYVPGVEEATVNLAAESARVLASDNVTGTQLEKAITKAGYSLGREELQLSVQGMSRTSCATRVENALLNVAGVVAASVNLATESVRVEVLKGTSGTDEIVRAIETAGYGTVAVEGATLDFTEQGNGTLVLVLGSSVYYPRTFSQRLKAYCRLMFLDMRHFARSSASAWPGSISIASYVEDIESACISRGLGRFVLVGHSHHGNMALEYAKRHPERVSRLVLIGTPPCNVQCTVDAGQQYWRDHASDKRKEALRRNLETYASLEVPSKPEDAFVAEYVAEGPRYWQNPDYDGAWLWQDVPINIELIKQFRGFFTAYEFPLRSVALAAPVLVIMGREDYAVPPFLWTSEFTDLFNVSFHLFEHSGHTPQLEEQELFDKIFLAWLKKASLS